MPEDTKRLLREATSGSADAVATLLERHLPSLEVFVRLRAGPALMARESVGDLVQSACREVLEDAGEFHWESEAHFRHWLFTTALRKIQDKGRHHRRARRDPAREQVVTDVDLLAGCANLITPSRVLEAKEQLAALESAFAELSEEQREVVLLARIVGLPHAAIAERIGKSEGATRVILHRALAKLATRMAE